MIVVDVIEMLLRQINLFRHMMYLEILLVIIPLAAFPFHYVPFRATFPQTRFNIANAPPNSPLMTKIIPRGVRNVIFNDGMVSSNPIRYVYAHKNRTGIFEGFAQKSEIQDEEQYKKHCKLHARTSVES